MKNLLKKILSAACVYYTVGTLLLFLVLLILTVNQGPKIPGLLNVILIFPFCLSLAGGNALLARAPFSKASCRFLHFGILLSAFLFFLWLPSNTAKSFGSGLIAALLFSILYWVVLGIVALTVKRFRSFKEE